MSASSTMLSVSQQLEILGDLRGTSTSAMCCRQTIVARVLTHTYDILIGNIALNDGTLADSFMDDMVKYLTSQITSMHPPPRAVAAVCTSR